MNMSSSQTSYTVFQGGTTQLMLRLNVRTDVLEEGNNHRPGTISIFCLSTHNNVLPSITPFLPPSGISA